MMPVPVPVKASRRGVVDATVARPVLLTSILGIGRSVVPVDPCGWRRTDADRVGATDASRGATGDLSGFANLGVESICAVLRSRLIAPNTYYTAKKRGPSARVLRDAELMPEIRRVYDTGLAVYGADKIWTQLNREGIEVARCTVERLMRLMGLSGARRGKAFKITTTSDDRLERPADLVNRVLHWGTEPVVGCGSDVCQNACRLRTVSIVDVFSRMIVGWQASTSLRSDLAIDALEMAVWNRHRQGQNLAGPGSSTATEVRAGSKWSSQHPVVEVLCICRQQAADRAIRPTG
ncbi:MAG: IS3 family transposase [Acidimicrobiales bacterium]